MPRIRSIKPEMPSDRKLASVSIEARFTFVLLISQVDDDGLLRAEPRQLLGTLYPFDEEIEPHHLETWLTELESIGGIRFRNTRDGVRVVELVNWARHQQIKNRSKPFLLYQLVDLPATDRRVTDDPTSVLRISSVGPGGAEPRVLSLEPGVEGAAAAAPNGRRTTDSDQYRTILEQIPAPYRGAFEGAVRAAKNPAPLLAELEAVATGLHPPAYSFAVIGRALHELAVAGSPVTARSIRGFCRKIAADPAEEIEDRTDGFGRMMPHRKLADGTWEPMGSVA